MARLHFDSSDKSTSIIRGSDHALGSFVTVYNRHFAASNDDVQGEGIVMDWDELFGFTTNLIGAKLEDLNDHERLFTLANNYVMDAEYKTI